MTSPWVHLSSAVLSAAIDPQGAQLSVLRDAAGNDLLWDGDPAMWSGRAPLLFPIVGELAGGSYRFEGRRYSLSRHGFARRSRFELRASSNAAAVFALEASADTLPVYPFPFELLVHFALEGPTLSVTTSLHNPGDSALPASVGYHPGFRWPLPYGAARSAHYLEFAAAEPAPVRRLDTQGLLTAERHPTPVVGSRLALDDALFRDDALIFEGLTSRSVTYGAPTTPAIRVGFPDSPWLGLWSKPNAGFICIEPWNGIADPQNYVGDFMAKPGVFLVPPGGSRSITMTITLL